MNKLLISFIFILVITHISFAEIRTYILDSIEITDQNTGRKVQPILSSDGKQIKQNITIAGLGTKKVTAQYKGSTALSIETQIFPMNGNNGTGFSCVSHADGLDSNAVVCSEYYYTTYNNGAVIIELRGIKIRVYLIGDVGTYVLQGRYR